MLATVEAAGRCWGVRCGVSCGVLPGLLYGLLPASEKREERKFREQLPNALLPSMRMRGNAVNILHSERLMPASKISVPLLLMQMQPKDPPEVYDRVSNATPASELPSPGSRDLVCSLCDNDNEEGLSWPPGIAALCGCKTCSAFDATSRAPSLASSPRS